MAATDIADATWVYKRVSQARAVVVIFSIALLSRRRWRPLVLPRGRTPRPAECRPSCSRWALRTPVNGSPRGATRGRGSAARSAASSALTRLSVRRTYGHAHEGDVCGCGCFQLRARSDTRTTPPTLDHLRIQRRGVERGIEVAALYDVSIRGIIATKALSPVP